MLAAAVGRGEPDAAPTFPPTEPNVISVTALDSHSRSNTAANQGGDADFSAAGVRISKSSSHPAGSYSSGTSFAAPYVTAAAQVAREREGSDTNSSDSRGGGNRSRGARKGASSMAGA